MRKQYRDTVTKKDGFLKAFRVDVNFQVTDVASVNVVAETPEAAGDGAKEILSVVNPEFSAVTVVAVEEYKNKPTIQ